ncbi:Bas1 protein [Maudiozyma humilis]|uniref:Bas1 protein n=1 Tax=Maudiozyma humilis TaxID=51915 RepID=A0AAV5RWL5_MAUHU|nr:Bas1 protein [Kazachstania humilis]
MPAQAKSAKASGKKASKPKRTESFDLLEVTESLGYQIHRKSGRNSWSREEDDELRALMSEALEDLGYSGGIAAISTIQQSLEVTKSIPWDTLARRFRNNLRNGKDLRKRWSGSLDPNLKKGRWTKDEDERLIKAYEKHGARWLSVSLEISGRTEDQCAKRYIEVLGPGSKGRLRDWTLEEDLLLISKVKAYGTKWRKISSEMEFRPSLTCRNRWRKIITTVVRNQAAPEIVAAVKENKDLDLTPDGGNNNNTSNNTDTPDIKHEDSVGLSRENSISRAGSAPLPPQSNQSSTTPQPHFANGASDTLYPQTNMINRPASNPVGGAVQTDRLPNKNLPLLPGMSPSPGILENSVTPLGISTFPSRSTLHQQTQPVDSLSPLVRASGLLASNLRSPDNFTGPDMTSMDHLLRSQSADNITPTTAPTSASVQKQQDPAYVPKAPIPPLHTQTEWKFTLKDRKGLSISNGSISNSELVKELIGQARKYSLKISVHQHIHNHYGGGGSTRDSVNGNMANASTTSSSNSKGLSPEAISELYNNPYMVKSSESLPTDIIQKLNENQDQQNFNILESTNRTGTAQPDGSDANDRNQPTHYQSLEFALSPPNPENRNLNDRLFYNEHTKAAANPTLLTAGSITSASSTASPRFAPQAVQNRISPASLRTDGSGNSTTNNTPGSNGTMKSQSSDLPDVGPSRFSHFNYLPATIRPQLGSSDNRGTSDLNKILNPSPLSSSSRRKRSFGSKHKHSKARKKSRSHTSGGDESAVIHEERKGGNSRKSSKSHTTSSSEDGVDFWEKLRSLDRHGINAESTSNSSTNENTPANETDRREGASVPASEEEDVNDPFYYLKPSY